MSIFERSAKWLTKFWSWHDDARGFRWFFGHQTASGELVTPLRSLQLVTVWACVSLLADMDAMTPTDVCRKTPDGRIERVSHRIADLLNYEPNDEMTGFDLRAYQRMSEEIYGNSITEIIASSRGSIAALYPLDWKHVEVRRAGAMRRLVYSYRPGGGVPDRDLSPEQVIHHRTRITKDGVIGLSPIEQCAEMMGANLAVEKFGAAWFRNGAFPSLLWINKGPNMSQQAEQNFLDSQREALSGSGNAHKIGLVQGQFELQMPQISLQQSQFLETRRFGEAQCVQIYRVPPHLIGIVDKSTSWGTGISEQNTAFATYSLGPRFVSSEKQDRRSLLTRTEKESGLYLKRNVAAILRADIKGRYEAYKVGIDTGFMTPNDVRSLEDQNPAPGLDHYRFPLNTAYFDEAGNLINPNSQAVPQRTEAS